MLLLVRILPFPLLLFYTFLATANENPGVKVIKKQAHLEIEIVNGELQISENHLVEKEFYRDLQRNSRESIFYSDFDKLVDFNAATLIPGKSRPKTIKVTNTETKDIVLPGIFYGGYKRLDFVYPSLQNNSKSRLTYSKKIKDPHIIPAFYFVDRSEILNAEYTISFPNEVKINYKLFGENTDQIDLKKLTVKNKTTYTWTMRDIPAYENEKNAPGRSYRATHIIIFIEHYTYKSETIKVLSNVDDLYSWYTELVNKVDPRDNSNVAQQVREIVNNEDNEIARAQAIFRWVQKNIKYVAFENGMAGFIPRAPADVLNKRYGDCKDMANLLNEMLSYAKVDSYLAWIGTRSKPYSYNDVPSTVADNHMICAIKVDNQYLFLDATNQYATFGQPTSMIQGKEALVGIDKDDYQIMRVPTSDHANNIREDNFEVNLTNNDLSGSFDSRLTGYVKNDLEFSQLKAEIRSENEYLRDYFLIGDNNIDIFNESFQGMGNSSEMAEVDFSFTLPSYSRNIGNKIYLNLNLYRQLPGDKVDTLNRKSLVEEKYKYVHTSSVTFQIPENFEISYFPENRNYKWDHGEISASYQIKDNSIIYTKKYISDFLYLGKENFSGWNELLDLISTINQESIILQAK